jgi:protein-tyrosine phosphatase
MIHRSLETDLKQLQDTNVDVVLVCLDDYELMKLGIQWNDYRQTAKLHHLKLLRLPMIEGGTPSSLQELENILNLLSNELLQSKSIVCHCRCGIGRAGLVAACLLIRLGICTDASSAIHFVRSKRHIKAIETQSQEHFIKTYVEWKKDSSVLFF